MNKSCKSALALIAALFASPVVAHADDMTPGWYVGAGAGGGLAVDPTLHYTTTTATHKAEDKDVGSDFLGSGGYSWSNGLRLEGEFFHDQKNTKAIEGGYAGAGGHVSDNVLFANVLYDFSTGSRYTPYIGVGAGPDFVNVKSVGATGVGYLKGDTTVGAYQGIVGVSTQLDDNWAVTADYRYIASFDPKVDVSSGGQGRLDNASHNLILGVRYSFDTPEQVPPMHKAMAPMISPHGAMKSDVAPMTQDYTVFFDFNKSTITPEAVRVIAAAVEQYKAGGFAKITVTGHADTVGSDGYNDKLSHRRALAVEAQLKKLGVGANHIKKVADGKKDLLVPTGDGVREAHNRRAEIVLTK